jgi:predicted flap endonuclease-1-like 5' DNA nuclease
MLHLVGYIWIWLFLAFGLGLLIAYALWGVHSSSHPPLSNESSEEAERTIQEQQRLLEELRGELGTLKRERDGLQLLLKDRDKPDEALQTALQAAQAQLKSQAEELSQLKVASVGLIPVSFVEVPETPEAPPDDLTEIIGIGPFIASKLHNVGIESFKALAEITAEQQAALARQIEHFQSRITRENWVDQAQELHKKKYGA